jgi:hypothetical protein
VEQVGVSRPCNVRNLVAHPPVMGLQAKCDSRDDEEEKEETSHGSNLAAGGFLPTVADMTHCERKLPSQNADPAVGLLRNLLFTLTSAR